MNSKDGNDTCRIVETPDNPAAGVQFHYKSVPGIVSSNLIGRHRLRTEEKFEEILDHPWL